MTRLPLACLVALLATACSDRASHEPVDNGTSAATAGDIRTEVAGDMAAIRLKAAEERITQLERHVAELENKPEKLDLQLLTQRLEAVEKRVYARADAPAAVPPASGGAGARSGNPPAAPAPGTNRFNPFGL